jgi:hypothetical protein
MSRIIDPEDALAKLTRMTQATSNPSIEADLEDILEECQLASLWVTATAYAVGDVVQPNTPNGHRYTCIAAGTSGATEPAFDTGRDSETSDGDDLVWQESGTDYACLWDLRAAAYEGWLLKAAKVSNDIDFSSQGTKFSQSQAYDMCLRQAQKFTPVFIG